MTICTFHRSVIEMVSRPTGGVVALQQANGEGKAGNIRPVCLLSNCLRCTHVGFEVTVAGGTLTKNETSFVHRKLVYSAENGHRSFCGSVRRRVPVCSRG